jgi:hypothetical protein
MLFVVVGPWFWQVTLLLSLFLASYGGCDDPDHSLPL